MPRTRLCSVFLANVAIHSRSHPEAYVQSNAVQNGKALASELSLLTLWYSKKIIDTPSNDDVVNEESAPETEAMCGVNTVPAWCLLMPITGCAQWQIQGG